MESKVEGMQFRTMSVKFPVSEWLEIERVAMRYKKRGPVLVREIVMQWLQRYLIAEQQKGAAE